MDKKVLPTKDRSFLEGKNYQFREISDGARNGLIIDSFVLLPENKFTVKESSLLILLPQGYPDVPPDMFYFAPEVKLAASNTYPGRAHSKVTYFQTNWQCWSRHAPPAEWRAGIDGIHSYLQRVYLALKIAS
jgi:hypothetical protein